MAHNEPQIFDIAIPNPMFEGTINLYVIAGEPLTVIDTGIGTPEAWQALEAGLANHGLSVDAIQQVVLTHKHADHIGQAADIRERSGAKVFVHEDDWEGVTQLDRLHEEWLPLVCHTLRTFHTPEEEVQKIAELMGERRRVAKQTEADKLVDGQKLSVSNRDLEVIHTPGHTQGSISLRFGRYLFVGDHVLPTISPNVGAGEMRRTGMLRRYLDSLARVARLQSYDLIALPGHGPRFTNLAERAGQLITHHDQREEKILKILRADGPKTVYEIARTLWRNLPGYHLALGTAEVHAHLEKSCDQSLVRQENGRYWAA